MWSSDKPTKEGAYWIDWSEQVPMSCLELFESGGALYEGNGRPLDDWWEAGIGLRRLGPFTVDDVKRGMLTRDPCELLKMLTTLATSSEEARNVIRLAAEAETEPDNTERR